MAYFAEIDDHNIVTRVLLVPDEQAHRGQDFMANDLGLGGRWIETEVGAWGGDYYPPDGDGTPIRGHVKAKRKNSAGIGFTFDPDFGPDGAFIPPQPFPSWTLNPTTALWDAPTPMPETEGMWVWDEDTLSWVDMTPAE